MHCVYHMWVCGCLMLYKALIVPVWINCCVWMYVSAAL